MIAETLMILIVFAIVAVADEANRKAGGGR